jgi:hypothetical protein
MPTTTDNVTPRGDPALRTSMGHSGCINMASWLECGWRISTATPSLLHSSNNCCDGIYLLPSSECWMQLLTSGDNVLVKFWDASSSIGSLLLLPGGSATIMLYLSPRMPVIAPDELIYAWRGIGRARLLSSSSSSSATIGGNYDDGGGRHHRLPGTVHHLAMLSTGHHRNVFHATPVPHRHEKVATCRADGHLWLHNMAVQGMSPALSGNNAGVELSAVIVSSHLLEGDPLLPSSEQVFF